MDRMLARGIDLVRRFHDSDIYYSFRSSKVTVVAASWTLFLFAAALLAPLISPQNPYNPVELDILEAFTPPVWQHGGVAKFLLGSDDQGRDLLSVLMYGTRISLVVGFSAVLFAMALGVGIGLMAGYIGGALDGFLMRVADIHLSFPGILIALLIDGIARGVLPKDVHDQMAVYVIILAIGISGWVGFARTVRAQTLVEKQKEYVLAARVIGRRPWVIMVHHILPNVMGPVLVLATLGLGFAIVLESTLSYLGIGMPPTEPSLGRLIRGGQDYLFSGEWWLVIFPGVVLASLVLAVNLLGDWMRDAFNPKLR